MKRKAPLTLMELMVMILVFALAAALCLQAFAKSDRVSRDSEAHDRAAVACQSVAEVIHHYGGDMSAVAEYLGATTDSEDALLLFYGTDWQLSEPLSPGVYPLGYTLGASREETHVTGLGKATVWVQEDRTGAELFRLEISWQEAAARPDTRSSRISQEDQDRAMALCQNMAEMLRNYSGDMGEVAEHLGYNYSQGLLWQDFDKEWNPTENGVYRLEAQGIPADEPSIETAKVRVVAYLGDIVGQEPEVLFEMEATWPEEVTGNG